MNPLKAAASAPRRGGWTPFDPAEPHVSTSGEADGSAAEAAEPETGEAAEGDLAAGESDDAVFSIAVAKRPPLTKPAPTPPIPRWLFNLIGHVIAGMLGLGLGYLILHQLRPETFPLPW